MDAKTPLILTITRASNGEMVDAPVFICPENAEYEVVEVMERHEVLGTDGGAVTLDVVKAASATAIAGATTVLSSTFNLKATVATTVRKTVASGLVAAKSTRRLTAGQALGLDFGGTQTAVAGLVVVIVLALVRAGTNR